MVVKEWPRTLGRGDTTGATRAIGRYGYNPAPRPVLFFRADVGRSATRERMAAQKENVLPLDHSAKQIQISHGVATQKFPTPVTLAVLEVCCLPLGLGGGVSGDIRGPPGPFSFHTKEKPQAGMSLGLKSVASA